jgi:hypothetical protein
MGGAYRPEGARAWDPRRERDLAILRVGTPLLPVLGLLSAVVSALEALRILGDAAFSGEGKALSITRTVGHALAAIALTATVAHAGTPLASSLFAFGMGALGMAAISERGLFRIRAEQHAGIGWKVNAEAFARWARRRPR